MKEIIKQLKQEIKQEFTDYLISKPYFYEFESGKKAWMQPIKTNTKKNTLGGQSVYIYLTYDTTKIGIEIDKFKQLIQNKIKTVLSKVFKNNKYTYEYRRVFFGNNEICFKHLQNEFRVK